MPDSVSIRGGPHVELSEENDLDRERELALADLKLREAEVARKRELLNRKKKLLMEAYKRSPGNLERARESVANEQRRLYGRAPVTLARSEEDVEAEQRLIDSEHETWKIVNRWARETAQEDAGAPPVERVESSLNFSEPTTQAINSRPNKNWPMSREQMREVNR